MRFVNDFGEEGSPQVTFFIFFGNFVIFSSRVYWNFCNLFDGYNGIEISGGLIYSCFWRAMLDQHK